MATRKKNQGREIVTAVRLENYKGSGEAKVFLPGEEDALATALEELPGVDHEAELRRLSRKGHLTGFVADADLDDEADENHEDPDLRATARRQNAQVQSIAPRGKKASTLRRGGRSNTPAIGEGDDDSGSAE